MKPLASNLAQVQEQDDNNPTDTSLFFKLYEDYKILDTETQDARRVYREPHTMFTRQMKA
jgi:hypothetical protein